MNSTSSIDIIYASRRHDEIFRSRDLCMWHGRVIHMMWACQSREPRPLKWPFLLVLVNWRLPTCLPKFTLSTYISRCLLVLLYLYVYPSLLVFTYVYTCLSMFTSFLVFTYVCSCLPMFATVQWCLLMFATVYSCLFAYVYPSLLVLTYGYTCLPIFTYVHRGVYLCLPLFTRAWLALFTRVYLFSTVYSCLPILFTVYSCLPIVYSCLHNVWQFSRVYLWLPLFSRACLPSLPMLLVFTYVYHC